jgi:hypothetical protein
MFDRSVENKGSSGLKGPTTRVVGDTVLRELEKAA